MHGVVVVVQFRGLTCNLRGCRLTAQVDRRHSVSSLWAGYLTRDASLSTQQQRQKKIWCFLESPLN